MRVIKMSHTHNSKQGVSYPTKSNETNPKGCAENEERKQICTIENPEKRESSGSRRKQTQGQESSSMMTVISRSLRRLFGPFKLLVSIDTWRQIAHAQRMPHIAVQPSRSTGHVRARRRSLILMRRNFEARRLGLSLYSGKSPGTLSPTEVVSSTLRIDRLLAAEPLDVCTCKVGGMCSKDR